MDRIRGGTRQVRTKGTDVWFRQEKWEYDLWNNIHIPTPSPRLEKAPGYAKSDIHFEIQI